MSLSKVMMGLILRVRLVFRISTPCFSFVVTPVKRVLGPRVPAIGDLLCPATMPQWFINELIALCLPLSSFSHQWDKSIRLILES